MDKAMNQVTSEDLFGSYSGLHDSIYDNQSLMVTGTLVYSGPDSYGLPCVEYGDSDTGQAWVACVLSGADQLSAGDRVNITGHVEGFTQGMVVLKHCSIDEVL